MSRNFTASLLIETATARKGIQDLTKDTLSLNTSLTALASTLKATEGNLASTAKQMAQISQQARTAASAMDTSAKSRIQASRLEAKEISNVTAAEKARATAALTAQRNAAASANSSRASYYDGREARGAILFAQAQERVRRSTDEMGNSLSNSRYLLYDMGATYRTLAIGLLAIPAASTAMAISYEKDFAQVIRTTQSTAYVAEELRGQLKQLATEIPLSFGELSNIAMIGGQMNIASDQLAAFTKTVATFVATADGMDIESATQMFGRLQNLFNTNQATGGVLDPAFFDKIGSAISKTADNSVTSEKAISAMLSKMAAVGKQAGMSATDVTALASALTSVGIQPELGSGMITRFFGGLNVAVASGGKQLDAYAKYLGKSRGEIESMVRTKPQQLFQEMLGAIKSMNSVDGARALKEMGISATRDIRVVQALSAQMHVYENAIKDVNGAYEEGTYLDKSAQGIFGTTAANAQIFANTLANLGDTLGRNVLPYLTSALKAVTMFTNGFMQFLDTVPLAKQALGTLLAIATAAGGWMLFKSVLAMVSAALTGFQHTVQALGARAITASATMTKLNAVTAASRASMASATAATTAQGTALARTTVQMNAATAASAKMAAADTVAAKAKQGMAASTLAAINGLNNGSAAIVGASGAATKGAGKFGALGSAMKSIGSSALAMVGGPLGATALGILAIGTAAINSGNKLTELSKQVAEAFNVDQSTGLQALQKSLDEKTSFMRTGLDFNSMGKSYKDLAAQIGLSFEDIADAYSKGTSGMDALITKVKEEQDAWRSANPWATDGGKYQQTIQFLENQRQALEENKVKVEELDGAKKASGADTSFKAGTDSDTAAVDRLSDAIDSALDSVFALTNAKGNLTKALSTLGEGIGNNGTSFSTGDTAGVTNLANLQAVLQAQAQVFKAAIADGEMTAQTASVQYSQFVQSLMSQIASMGADTSQIKDLADASAQAFQGAIAQANADGSLDLQVGADVSQAQDTVNSFMAVTYEQFNNSEFKAIIGADTDLAGTQVQSLFEYIIANTNMDYTAVLTALGDPASAEAQNLAKYLHEIVNNGKYEAAIGADTSVGASNVMNYANWAQGILAQLQSNLNTVNQQIAAHNNNSEGGLLKGMSLHAQKYVLQGQIAAIKSAGYQDKATKSAAQSIPAYKGMGDAMKNGYDKGAKAAEKAAGSGGKAGKAAKGAGKAADKAGEAAKKAGEKALDAAQKALDKLKEWDAAYKAIAEYAGRVGNAFGYVKNSTRGVSEAMDAYYSAVNSAKERVDDLKQSVKDLRDENKKLAAEMQTDKNDASKYDQLSKLAASYGDKDRAKYYADEAKSAKESAKEKQKQIDANKKEADSIEKGIGNLKGYSQAAIDNRAEVRKLEDAALDVAVAYANAGKSAGAVKDATVKWTEKAKTHSRQLGYSKTDIDKVTSSTKNLTDMLNKVPTSKQINIAEKKVTTLQAKNETKGATDGARKNIGSVPGSKTTKLGAVADKGSINNAFNKIPSKKTVKLELKPGYAPGYAGTITYVDPKGKQSPYGKLTVNNRGGYVGLNQRMSGFARGGMVPGTPPNNPREDNLLASVDGQGMVKIRSGEFIMRQESVDYYGQSFMNKLNQMQLPRYYMGGMPGKSSSNSTNGGMVDLSAETIQAIARATAPEVALYVDSTEIARANAKGSKQLAQRGLTFG